MLKIMELIKKNHLYFLCNISFKRDYLQPIPKMSLDFVMSCLLPALDSFPTVGPVIYGGSTT